MKELKFVDVGEGITEGHIQKWLVKDMAQVGEDQPVVQVETDKAVVSVPAPITGVVKIAANEGTDVRIGDIIAYFGTAEELGDVSAHVQAAQTGQKPVAPQKQTIQEHEILATPSVRKLAHDLNVEITKAVGTGPAGRVLENDIRMLANKDAQQSATPKFSELKEEQHGEEIERVQMSQVRKAIAKNMELSWTIPRAVHMDLVDATHLSNIVAQEKPNAEKMGIKLTFLPFIIKATVEALKENRTFNASYDKEKQEIIVKKYYNIGIATEAEDGLRVVVIKEADRKSIMGLAKEIHELSEKVKSKTVSIEEMSDSSFTITNIGSLGGGFLSVPMINYPDVAILGVHLIKDTPIVEDGKIAIGKLLPISISFDHRVVDGAEAVRFGNSIKRYLEDPEFLEMLG